MERIHRSKLTAKFNRNLRSAPVICLDIPDDYEFMAPDLVRVLMEKVPRHLPERQQKPRPAV